MVNSFVRYFGKLGFRLSSLNLGECQDFRVPFFLSKGEIQQHPGLCNVPKKMNYTAYFLTKEA